MYKSLNNGYHMYKFIAQVIHMIYSSLFLTETGSPESAYFQGYNVYNNVLDGLLMVSMYVSFIVASYLN